MIKKGTIIYEATPLAHNVSVYLKRTHCDFCFTKGTMKKCKACQCVSYCDAKCQFQAWKQYHKNECKDLICYPEISDEIRLLSRIIRKLKKTEIEEKFYSLDGGDNTFWEDENRVQNFRRCFSDLCHFMGLRKTPKVDVVMEIYSRMHINSVRMEDYRFANIGQALYLFPKTLKHSCEPNTTYVHFKRTIIVSTVEDIPGTINEINWDNLTICLGDPVQSLESRRILLKENYFRECHCKRCTYPERVALCPNKNCQAACSIEEDVCPTCKEPLTKEFKRNYLEALNFVDENIDFYSIVPQNTKILNVCLKRLKDVVTPLHTKYIKVLRRLQAAEKQKHHWMRALKHLEEIHDVYKYYYGPLNYRPAAVQLQMAKLHLYTENRNEYNKCMANAETIFGSLYGSVRAHEYMQQVVKEFAQLLAIALTVPCSNIKLRAVYKR